MNVAGGRIWKQSAQEDGEVTLEIYPIELDTASNNTEIYWTPSDSADVEFYNLYYEVNTPNGPEGVKFATVDADKTSFTHIDIDAGKQSWWQRRHRG